MKINFWQVLGVLLVIGGVIGIAYNRGYFGGPEPAPTTLPSTTQPAS